MKTEEKIFSRVVFSLFQSNIANSFYSKINVSSGVGTKVYQAVGPGSNLCRARFFKTSMKFVRISKCSNGKEGKTTGFWSGSSEFESQPLPTFFNFINTTENGDSPPLLSIKFFATKIFFKHRKIPLRIVPVQWDKKFRWNFDTCPYENNFR